MIFKKSRKTAKEYTWVFIQNFLNFVFSFKVQSTSWRWGLNSQWQDQVSYALWIQPARHPFIQTFKCGIIYLFLFQMQYKLYFYYYETLFLMHVYKTAHSPIYLNIYKYLKGFPSVLWYVIFFLTIEILVQLVWIST